ncbi:MAG: sugar nucleotide-binding protein [Lentimicrobiaceae bacterium]|jgi:dTDP-4-dehydrorhamnose reductase|nr:sugar nucleotide-binding protein [Lentimicrobiaceae bacterium]
MESLKKKILIIDATSMSGHIISDYLDSLCKFQIIKLICDISLANNDNYIDIFNKELLEETIQQQKPDIIVNCLRLLIEESESNPDKAIYYNSFLPHFLAKIARQINAKVIQLSTDCVFSGKKGSYNEDDFKDGETFYARTKALGELINDTDLTIRTSFIGPNINHKNEELFHWFMSQKVNVSGYCNVYWTGVTTLELAKCIEKAILLDIKGIYHLVPKYKISKYDLLNLIKKIWGKNIIINKQENLIIDKSLIDNRNLIKVQDYEKMFNELFVWMNNNKLYCNYN